MGTSRDEMSMVARTRWTSSVPGRLLEARRMGRARSTAASRGLQKGRQFTTAGPINARTLEQDASRWRNSTGQRMYDALEWR